MLRRVAAVLLLAIAALGCASAPAPSTRSVPGEWTPAWPEMPVDPDTSAALGFAHAQVGKRYCWGGTGPDCFDCSGLVQAAWRSGGVKLPRTSAAQGRALAEVPLDRMQPGDILWWRHHVGLYVGNGEMIDAYHSRAGVVRRRVAVPQRVLRVRPR
ncbi:MAG: C40 family peptidase [Labilithrix sp.]|nr:C40 family peptidase [Labilithrix sp.]MCW5835131.1 C40 family peptidase [Labilithrix sp.]